MRIIRVFPKRTNATPDDDLVRINCQPGLFDQADEIHVSVAFTADIPVAEKLEKTWRHIAPTKIGGPAFDDPGGEFEPGRYLKKGYVITSRGCPNKCWFCFVPKREGGIRELEIKDGFNILDNNLLACSKDHIKKVFLMLKRRGRRPIFSGGLEARKLEPWIAEELINLNPDELFFAFDMPSALDWLEQASLLLKKAFPISSRVLRCFVLCGYKGDSPEAAELRIEKIIRLGFLPFAMIYKDGKEIPDQRWAKWSRTWTRPCRTIMESRRRGWIKESK